MGMARRDDGQIVVEGELAEQDGQKWKKEG